MSPRLIGGGVEPGGGYMLQGPYGDGGLVEEVGVILLKFDFLPDLISILYSSGCMRVISIWHVVQVAC